jgi:hypothetical protein
MRDGLDFEDQLPCGAWPQSRCHSPDPFLEDFGVRPWATK